MRSKLYTTHVPWTPFSLVRFVEGHVKDQQDIRARVLAVIQKGGNLCYAMLCYDGPQMIEKQRYCSGPT